MITDEPSREPRSRARPEVVVAPLTDRSNAQGRSVSAVDDGHVPFVVALTGGRREVVQPFDLLGAQLDAVGGGVLLDAGNPLGAGNRSDVVALREQPGQSDLCRCCSDLSGNGSDLVDDAQIALEVLAGEARV